MGDTKEYKTEQITLDEVCEKSNRKSYLLEDFGLLELEMIWIPSKVNYYSRLMGEFEEKKKEDDDSIVLIDSMIRSLEGILYFIKNRAI